MKTRTGPAEDPQKVKTQSLFQRTDGPTPFGNLIPDTGKNRRRSEIGSHIRSSGNIKRQPLWFPSESGRYTAGVSL